MKLTEQNIIAPFVGRQADLQPLSPFCRIAGDHSVISISAFLSDPVLSQQFGITDRLYDAWQYAGLDYELHLFLDGSTITRGFLEKSRTSASGHGRPNFRVLTPTQQELRIARRILHHITQSEKSSISD